MSLTSELDSRADVLQYTAPRPAVLMPPHPSDEELAFDWTLSERDINFILTNHRGPENLCRLAVQLCVMRKHRNGSHLLRTIRRQGFRGQYGIVALYVRRMRQAQWLAPWQRRSPHPLPAVTEGSRRLLTPRRATWLVLRPSEDAADHDHPQLAQLTTQAPELTEAVARAQDFAGVVRHRQPTPLEPWLARAAPSASPPCRRFATGLRADLAAVQAAVTLPWSQGPIDGHITRLKLLKQHMYGRARLDLLARRFLLAA